jgi:hypothetical protein
MSFVRCLDQALFQPRSGRRATQLQFETACERPPAAFGGSPPHGGGDASEASEGVADTSS